MRISVCMAVYNGEKYIKKQILSILDQIAVQDEIVIVEDCSNDQSLSIINEIKDPRIRVIKNQMNQGVIKSFEISLNNARGDLIFLSDQDDIWMPEKVQKFKKIFSTLSDVTLVLSDAEVINEEAQLIYESFFKIRGKFYSRFLSNLIKNKYHGCTMAFRKEMLKLILPFPDNIPMHDMWIGIVNSIYGEIFYIDQQLIQYRIHDKNTGRGMTNNSSIMQMIHWRVIMLSNIIKILLSRKDKGYDIF